MKLIIAGTRHLDVSTSFINDVLGNCLLSRQDISEVVCGMARGIDTCGKLWAKAWSIPVAEFPADWNKYGKSAGVIRNSEMAKYGDALLLIWDGVSKGSSNMKGHMKYKTIYEVIIKCP